MLNERDTPQFETVKSGITFSKAPVRKVNEVFDHVSSDDVDTDSYQIDHSHVGYL